MTATDLNLQFEEAVKDSKHLPDRPSNDTLLKLYSLFKQASDGDINAEPPTNPFDFVAKAKYDAWKALKGKSSIDAMAEYIGLIKKLKA